MANYTVYVNQASGDNGRSWAQAQVAGTPWLTLQKAIEGDPSGGVLAAGDTYTIKMQDYATRRDYATGKCVLRMANATYPSTVNIVVDSADGASTWLVDGEYYLATIGTWSGSITIKHCDFLGRTNSPCIDFTGNSSAAVRMENSVVAWASDTWGTGRPAYFEVNKTLTGSMVFSYCVIVARSLADYRSTIPQLTYDHCNMALGTVGSFALWFSNAVAGRGNLSITNSVVAFVADTSTFYIMTASDLTFAANSVWDFTGSTITASFATGVTDTGGLILCNQAGGVTSGQVRLVFSGTVITANSAAILIAIGPADEAATKVTQSPGGIQSPTFVNTTIKNNGVGGTLLLGYGLDSTVLHDCQFYCGSSGHGVQLTSNNLDVYNLFVTGNLGILNWGDRNHIHNCVLDNTSGSAQGSLIIGRPGATNAGDPSPLWLPSTGGEIDHCIVLIGPNSSCNNAFYAKNENVAGGAYSSVRFHDNAYLISNGAKVGYLGNANRTTLADLQAAWADPATYNMPSNEGNSTFQTVASGGGARRMIGS